MTNGKKDDDNIVYEENQSVEDAAGSGNEGRQTADDGGPVEDNGELDELDLLKAELEKKDKELSRYVEVAQRVKAEFDNYKKRTAREREQLYKDIKGDIIVQLLPVIDNLERALSTDTPDSKSVLEGVGMVLKQFMDILSKQGLEEIDALGKQFDPNLHNAVMHVEDDSYEQSTVVEVFQKGYKINDSVIRHSMVRVAN